MFNLIESKPIVGYLGAGVGFISGVLTFVKVVTPILGFAGALFGAIAGFLTLRAAWRNRDQST